MDVINQTSDTTEEELEEEDEEEDEEEEGRVRGLMISYEDVAHLMEEEDPEAEEDFRFLIGLEHQDGQEMEGSEEEDEEQEERLYADTNTNNTNSTQESFSPPSLVEMDPYHSLAASLVDNVIEELGLDQEQRRQILELKEEFQFLHFDQVMLMRKVQKLKEVMMRFF